jgi:large subunit ribosomal protein L5
MEKVMNQFQQKYLSEIRPQLMNELGYKNINQVPKLQKIVINMGVGAAKDDKKLLDNAVSDMRKIAGQNPVITRARKSVAGFKIREEWPIGCKVTLRGSRMYDFLLRLVKIAFPRIQDFRGFSAKAFDRQGNYNLGLREQIMFPEIDYDKIDKLRGMNITICTNAVKDHDAMMLLKAFGFPFKKN